jgi:hypothetical protein
MIIDVLLTFIYLIVATVTYPITLLPDASLSPNIASMIATANGYTAPLNAFVPLDTIVAVVAIVLVVDAGIFTYKIIMWAIKRLPTQS